MGPKGNLHTKKDLTEGSEKMADELRLLNCVNDKGRLWSISQIEGFWNTGLQKMENHKFVRQLKRRYEGPWLTKKRKAQI